MNKENNTLIERLCKDIITWDFIDISAGGDIYIETHEVVTYKILDTLSKVFKTDSINIQPAGSDSWRSCADCRDIHTLLTIKDAKFNIEDIHVCPMQEGPCGECW